MTEEEQSLLQIKFDTLFIDTSSEIYLSIGKDGITRVSTKLRTQFSVSIEAIAPTSSADLNTLYGLGLQSLPSTLNDPTLGELKVTWNSLFRQPGAKTITFLGTARRNDKQATA